MRRFILNTIFVALPVAVLLCAATAYYAFYVKPNLTRDLSQLGLIPFPTEKHAQNIENDNRKACRIESLETPNESTVWIFGDSFSINRGGYTDYLAADSAHEYIYVEGSSGNPFLMFVTAKNIGKTLPEHVVIECVERSLIGRLCDMDFQYNIIPPIGKGSSKRSKNIFLITQEYLRKRLGTVSSPVKEAQLCAPLFNCAGHEDHLYFYTDDLIFYPESSVEFAAMNLKTILFLIPQHYYKYNFLST